MADTIIDQLSWYPYGKKALKPQEIPTHDELIAFGAEETGYTIRDYGSFRADEVLTDGRNERTYSIDSKEGKCGVIYVPDTHGWYVEDRTGNKWRPKNLDELRDLMSEMDFQIERYGDLL